MLKTISTNQHGNRSILALPLHGSKMQNLGIFIHWGIYSVPMWSPKGTYEEWYKYWLDNKKVNGER